MGIDAREKEGHTGVEETFAVTLPLLLVQPTK